MKRNNVFAGIAALSYIVTAVCILWFSPKAFAIDDFSLQVTPSPLVATLKPGQVTELELKIRNAATKTEQLKIEPRGFSIKRTGGQVELNDNVPPAIASWVSFSQPRFTLQPGQWFTQKIRLNVPPNAGFSYSFALIINRQREPQAVGGSRQIKGSVAVFTLLNIDRPGALRKLEVTRFVTAKHMYEYLPAKLSITFKNTGNTIVQPYGNIFIQRGKSGGTPIGTLAVNESKSYILPDTERTLTAEWANGFPVYQSTTKPDGTVGQHLAWDWSKSSDFRIGHYTAKLVAVYNDGQRDVPAEGTIGFWVIPWRSMLLLLGAVSILWFLQHWRIKRKTDKAVKRALEAAAKKKGQKQDA